MFDFILFSFVVATTIVYILQKWKNRQEKLPPGPFRIPGIGNILDIQKAGSLHHALEQFSKKYGEIFCIQTGISKAVAITGYKAVKRVLTSDDYLNHSDSKYLLDRTYGKPLGLFFSSEDTWRETRLFCMKTMKDFGFKDKYSMESAVQNEFDEFSRMIQNITKDTNGLIHSKSLFTSPFLNCIWMMVTGKRYDYDDEKFKSLIQYSRRWFAAASTSGGALLNLYPFLSDYAPKLVGFDEIHEVGKQFQSYFEELIRDTRAEGNYLTEANSFIEKFLREIETQKNKKGNGDTFTDKNLASVLMDFFFGGSDTSTTLMTLSVFYMIQYPQIQQEVRREIDSVIGREKWPVVADREKLPFTCAVMMEMYRITSIVPIAPRKVCKDVVYDNCVIPKGSEVFVSLYSVHMDKEFWGDPHVFRPSRFLGPDGTLISTDHVMPFAYGKRICIGENTSRINSFLFFSRLIQQYTLEGDPANKGAVNTEMKPGGLTQSPHDSNFIMKLRT